jgi:hypothetical protein
MSDPGTSKAVELMIRFAERTGIASDRAERRYLWTDAFAVCNFLGLARASGDARYTQLAQRLVARVHDVLGRHRADDARTGWISGASDRDGEAHPTRGGLRIGKPLPERGPTEPFDEAREWDRDGQYFHYLTKWMHALDQLARATGEPVFNRWARELAAGAYDAFTYAAPGDGRRRMYWKISIDRSRPLVASMGHHDPLDGYITYVQLQTTASWLPGPPSGPNLGDDAAAFAAMLAGTDLTTGDPLGLGGLLSDACRVAQLMQQGAFPGDRLLEDLLSGALAGLRYWAQQGELEAPPSHRLAFRELGLAIGLQAVEWMTRQPAVGDATERSPGGAPGALLTALGHYVPLGGEIVSFWRDAARHDVRTWSEHRDINEVMLATALAPEGFLVLRPPR